VIGRLSLTTRLSLLFMLALTGVLLAAGLTVNLLSREHFLDLDRHALHEKLQASQRLLGGLQRVEQLESVRPALHTLLGAHQDLRAQLFDGAGRLLLAEPTQASIPERFRHQTDELWEWWEEGRLLRGLSAELALDEPGESLTLLLALDVTHHADFFTLLQRWLWLALAICALLSTGLGWLVARSGLRPLREVTQVAATVSARSLKERIPEASLPVELRPLVSSFNGMLERLDDAFVRLSNFSADIAHELRTPISNLMTQTQVALSRPRTVDEYQDILASNLEEYERIARMVSDMLFLAKAEGNTLAHAGESIDLAREADALIDFYEALADERQVRIVRQGQASVQGDRLMLRRALSNLISNALRHTPKEGQITIRIDADAAGVRLAVSNVGDPIPADQIERIFERFHRGSAQRESRGEGAGLGLAITRSIVQAHGGHITARSAEGVTCFTITLPRNEASSPS